MPAPNKKNIEEWLGDYLRKAGIDAPWAASEMAKKIKSADSHKSVDSALDYVNNITNGHGVEAIRGEYHVDNYYHDIVALYVNMGDTYNATLLYETDRGRFLLTTWGDWVERNQKKYSII